MEINNAFFVTKTDFGYKLSKLTKQININDYDLVKVNNDEYFLERKDKYKLVSFDDISSYNFKYCKIISCYINNGAFNGNSLNKILVQIYKTINNSQEIISNSALKIFENKKNNYQYIKNLNISYTKPNNNMAIYEIYNQIKKSGIKLELKIELYNNDVIKLYNLFN
jgi:hypothetical protein